jgi:hypothetical protein
MTTAGFVDERSGDDAIWVECQLNYHKFAYRTLASRS